MPLTIRSRTTDRLPISWRGLIPSALANQSLDEVQRTTIPYGNSRVPMAELFAISGNPSDGEWRLEGDFSSVHQIGSGMDWGTIHATGPLGRHVGSLMRDGRIVAENHVGDYLGAEMRGGVISVGGNAGDHVGGAYVGAKSGMRAGTITVAGDVGSHVGYAMRRGTLVVGGSCGEWPAYRMRGGTLYIGGACGERPGAELRRGTILLVGEVPPLLPTFRYACNYQSPVLRLLERELRSIGVVVPMSLSSMCEVYNGDINEGGRGELLLVGRSRSL